VAKARELEAQLHRVEAQLHLIQRIARHLVRTGVLSDSLQHIVAMVSDLMQADSCLLYLLGDEDLILVAAKDPQPGAIGNVRLRLSEGLTGWVARERRLLAISQEAYNDSRFKFFRDLPEDTFEAFLSAPVIVSGKVIGVINLQHRRPHAHTGDEMEMLTTVGELIGCRVTMARLESGPEQINYSELALRTLPAEQAP
jgi:signal transduction protein with GAF and PtsI domain